MIVVGTTLAAFACEDEDTSLSWLKNAEQIQASWPEPVVYFAALELDARGLDPFAPVLERMREVGGFQWTFHLDDGRTTVTTANRLRHITMGQNLATDYALSHPACTHLLFLAGDLEPPPDALTKLVEVDHPLVGGHVPTYCLDGPRATAEMWTAPARPMVVTVDVRAHMASAAFVLIRRDLLRFVRWRWDLDAGMSDDPCLQHDAREFHGVETLVRHDCIGRHHPESIGPIETRYPGVDMSVHRGEGGGMPDPEWRDRHAEGFRVSGWGPDGRPMFTK